MNLPQQLLEWRQKDNLTGLNTTKSVLSEINF